MLSENQNIEYKESWRDEHLKWICGFANAAGGKLIIGVRDDLTIKGVENPKKLMEDIPNKVGNGLGLVVEVDLQHSEGRDYIVIHVEKSAFPISYHGKYYYRSGATLQELNGATLHQFALQKLGLSFDSVPVENVTIEWIDRQSVEYFIERSIEAGRMNRSERDASTESVLQNLGLYTTDGKLTNAALLLFGKDVGRFFPTIQFKIGRFYSENSELIIQDVVESNLIQMADQVVKTLRAKYLLSPIHYEGLQRIEELEIPEEALREVIYNAIVHKDYTGPATTLRVYDQSLVLWNYGMLPTELTPESLMKPHESYPRNAKLASVFYRAGFIESWGQGFRKIHQELEGTGLPMPTIEEVNGGVSVTMRRFTLEEIMAHREAQSKPSQKEKKGGLTANCQHILGQECAAQLSQRQCEICNMICDNPMTTIKEMAVALGVSPKTIHRELSTLQTSQIVKHEGSPNSGVWIVLPQNQA